MSPIWIVKGMRIVMDDNKKKKKRERDSSVDDKGQVSQIYLLDGEQKSK